jgi:hypothetical protein
MKIVKFEVLPHANHFVFHLLYPSNSSCWMKNFVSCRDSTKPVNGKIKNLFKLFKRQKKDQHLKWIFGSEGYGADGGSG